MYPRPDYDCNGVDDTTQGHCSPDGLTKCESSADCPNNHPCLFGGDAGPYYAEDRPFSGSNSDGRGDACQCGDLNGDGAIKNIDIPGAALCANSALPNEQCDETLHDTNGDLAITAFEIGALVAVINGQVPTTEMLCARDQVP